MIDENEKKEMTYLLHKAGFYSRMLLAIGLIAAFITVAGITYVWLFYNP